ncbi:hypothetical protein [Brevundimonas subvibrioides]|uniref:Uncharacterized protein n=1 Tax=Brevundimonas subvibrioides (strain ATCC 15264 / DSM 4735 / LMG 14903 / NBRC 16000 / CB 81) TaxID=633149 RepID=D9QHU0_BRESC|nr:hypothetical protein [Brevundimonas subvibrioides]ADK99365.1 hypothetical protein Bresu_0050 [Brevundimonas subvibrioides ATCC 15264]
MNDNLQTTPATISPARRVERIARHAARLGHGPGGRISAAQILRDIEAMHPGEVERQAARIAAGRGVGPARPLDTPALDWPQA